MIRAKRIKDSLLVALPFSLGLFALLRGNGTYQYMQGPDSGIAYGFPLPYHLDIYMYGYPVSILAFILDLLFYFAVTFLLFWFIAKCTRFKPNKYLLLISWIAAIPVFSINILIPVFMFSQSQQFYLLDLR